MVASVMRLARAERGRVYADRVKAMQTWAADRLRF